MLEVLLGHRHLKHDITFVILFPGAITSRRSLPPDVKSYQMIVKAEVNRVSYALVPVQFNIRAISPTLSNIKFSRSSYSIVISDKLIPGSRIYDVPIQPPKARKYIVYDISGKNRYFSIHKYLGTLKSKYNFSRLNLTKNSSKPFRFTVVTKLRESSTITASATVEVIVIPAFSGDHFNHLVEKTKDNMFNHSAGGTASPFEFHRFFRQLSPTAKKISKAEMKFDKIIRELRQSVVDGFRGMNEI